jgi:hypothetical protein
MRIDPNDPKITAYLLDELEEAERKEIEKVLAEDAESRQHVEELRETTQALAAEFARDPDLALSSSHRKVIEEELSGSRATPAAPVDGQIRRGFYSGFFGWRFGVAFSVAMVALIASVAYFNPSFNTVSRTVYDVAKSDAPEPVDRPQEELATILERAASVPPASAPGLAAGQVTVQPAPIVERDESELARGLQISPVRPEIQLRQEREYLAASKEPEAVLADTRKSNTRTELGVTVMNLDEYVVDPHDRNADGLQEAPVGPTERRLGRKVAEVNDSDLLNVMREELKEGLDPTVGDRLERISQSAPQHGLVTQSGSLVLDSAPAQPGAGLGGGIGGLYGGYGGIGRGQPQSFGYAPGPPQRVEDPSVSTLTYP